MVAALGDASTPRAVILEGLVTTIDETGQPHLAPMGPRVHEDMSRFVLRPFQSSRTYQNLRRTPCGVFHVTDDVELLARAAVDQLPAPPPMTPATIAAESFPAFILDDACRWYAFRVAGREDRDARATLECVVVDRGVQREFFGFNRAKHAVLEAAILATRVGIVPAAEITGEMKRLAVIVDKTGGRQERRAFDFLRDYLASRLPV